MPLREDPSSKASCSGSKESLSSEIISVLIPCLCIGCAISLGSLDYSSIISTAEIEVEELHAKESFYRLMKSIQHFILKHECSSTLEGKANILLGEALSEVTDKIKERESQEILRSVADKHYVVSASLFVGTIILAVLLTKSLVE